MTALNSKFIDIIFNPCETIKVENLILDLGGEEPFLKYKFNIQISIQERFQSTIFEKSHPCKTDNHQPKALISSDVLKKLTVTIFSTDYPLPTGAFPLDSHTENISKQYEKGSYLVEGEEYREKILLHFKVVTQLKNPSTEQLQFLDNNFCYELYLESNEAGTDCTINIDDLSVSWV